MTDKEFIDSMSEHPEYLGSSNFIYVCEHAGSPEFTSCKNEYDKLLEKEGKLLNVEYDLGLLDIEHEMNELSYRAHYDANKTSGPDLSEKDLNWYSEKYKQLEEKAEKQRTKVPFLKESRQGEFDRQKEQFKKACDQLIATFSNQNQ